MDGSSHNLRRHAIQKIAALSAASSPRLPVDMSQFTKLCHACPPLLKKANSVSNEAHNRALALSKTPIRLSELDVLLALCKTAPLLEDNETAERLLTQISPYLSEAHVQVIAPSPSLRSIDPSPWEALTYHLTRAILAIGIKYPSLHKTALDCMSRYLYNCLRTVDALIAANSRSEEFPRELDTEVTFPTAILAVSLLGFLDATSNYAHFYDVPERLDLVTTLRQIFTEAFMVSVEGVFSSIRTSEPKSEDLSLWKSYTRRYAASGRPIGAMLLQRGFMRLLVSFSSLHIASQEQLQRTDVFDILLSKKQHIHNESNDSSGALLEVLSDAAAEEMRLLEDGSDYLRLGSAWQQRLAFSVKAHALNTFLNCMVADEDIADADTLISWLEDTMADPVQMADDTLACVVLKSMATVARFSPDIAPTLSRSLPRFIVQGGIKGETVSIAARCLTSILQLLSQDAVITGLYSLGNVLSAGSSADRSIGSAGLQIGAQSNQKNTGRYSQQHSTSSTISLELSGDEEKATVYGNIVRAIVSIANSCCDDKITALALSMLLQKLGKVSLAADVHIITEAAMLAKSCGLLEFKSLLKLYSRISHEGILHSNDILLNAVRRARVYLSQSLQRDSPLFQVYLVNLLENIVSKGDVHESDNTHKTDVELAAREIVELLQPLACLVSVPKTANDLPQDENVARLHREAWFNIIVHGITPISTLGQQFSKELQIIALQSRSLIAEDHADQLESEIELNTVLRRGMNGAHTAEQKRRLISLLPGRESDIRSLSYPKVIFLSTAYLVETLRADAGDCTHILAYFLDPSLNGSAMEGCMSNITDKVVEIYLRRTLGDKDLENSAPLAAKQLASMLTGCCHRVPRVQQIASASADKIIRHLPSSLCQKSSLFALLELLTILWTSCLEAELDEYELKSKYISVRGEVEVELSDNYDFRRSTLNAFYKRAKGWVMAVVNIAPLDVKGLLQTYLSEYDDDGAYGHVSLGRSFAVEMGSVIPSTDQKLAAIDHHGDCSINTASDFVAQYTTRQEYRYADALPDYDPEWANFLHINGNGNTVAEGSQRKIEDDQAILAHLERRTLEKRFVSVGELRDILRRAAALLCRTKRDQCAIVHHLVGIPFAIFTKQSIKLGVSLWLGVINENPLMEPRILSEIAQSWEKTVHNRVGVFGDKLRHLDPFYLKQEFAPSDKSALLKQQQAAHDLIAPHLRILLFLTSHFNATRLGSIHTQRIFHRLITVTLQGLKPTAGHPLAREIHFQMILFGLNLLRYHSSLDQISQWRLKDTILSAALSWFCQQPRWSFGGNRLQIKAETRLLADVDSALRAVALVGSKTVGVCQALTTKQDLLQLLLENEQLRLVVWLYPLDHGRRHIFSSAHSGRLPSDATLSAVCKAAWAEHPGLAIQLVTRFQSQKLTNDVRWLLLNFPERAIGEPDALQIVIGSSMSTDLSFQLKYLLYWAPVNPITAVTYFLPDYGYHPFIVQYAMRALESHSVDVTFFYVPQIVQTLRFDVLGYVQRYIVETAKFSQLFAHQIIWNMKANAYKDEDSSIEDSLKPTLDVVTDNMIKGFSGTDKAFYEREFSFFNEITDISGKLRPYIKRTKPEKKQKIEEELRKIKVEVGVYLPSNPDGTVIGIDRKSGKPLQSHAKAPYMATFRIKKNRGGMEGTDDMLEKTNQNLETSRNGPVSRESTYEVWQSAIFKVGDDCRQDVLALQMIAAFRGIFNSVGLDVYVYPYRVTATAPGCGVIDVLPNSISRDMLGREAVNGLYDYFVSKYGAENSIRFQEARNNFVKSMAAYSVISYLLQFKDRHNGNIMVDDTGHILHIDFGFCFDIAPGGVRFERAPFKLTSEMVAVMGGSTTSQSYKWFEELCIKSFLASRQHTEKLCHIVVLMLGSGLPCFKPETISHLRERFVLEKSEREAADFMRDLIKKSYSSYSTIGYDQFQLLTNGIPY